MTDLVEGEEGGEGGGGEEGDETAWAKLDVKGAAVEPLGA